MTAAVADFRPVDEQQTKIKKQDGAGAPTLELTLNPDILAGLVADRSGTIPVIVGFAAETGDEAGSVMDYARAKLARKGCDLLVVNRVDGGRAFEVEQNAAVILSADGAAVEVGFGPKSVVAAAVCDAVAARLALVSPRSADFGFVDPDPDHPSGVHGAGTRQIIGAVTVPTSAAPTDAAGASGG